MLARLCSKSFKLDLRSHVNWQIPDVWAGFRKGRGTRDQIASIHWIIEKAREFQKNLCFCFTETLKPLTVWITTNCRKFFKNGNTRSHYLPPEKSVCRSRSNRTGHGKTDWFQIGKGVHQGCILSPAYLTICRVHHVKCWAGWSTSWNQDGQKKYQ